MRIKSGISAEDWSGSPRLPDEIITVSRELLHGGTSGDPPAGG